ncbi:MAG: hypothetical protein EHM58_06180 [Ignavibacteriae bacterium]|nr:MAG: hypothetical protein EHM58_06180 [Ignavibacteriota bacterium]
MILDFEKKWKTGQVLKIYFMNGDEEVKEKVFRTANRWIEESGANLSFERVEEPQNAEIRVEFGKSTRSLVGNDLLNEEIEFSNICFREAIAENLSEQKILHEFGHVLGLIHEIFHPLIPITFNYSKLKQYYMHDQGYSAAEYEANVGRTYRKNEIQYFDFDENSIMMYPIPSSTNDQSINYEQPQVLSQMDKEFLKLAYPDVEDNVVEIKNGDNIERDVEKYAHYDLYKFCVIDVCTSEFESKRTANCVINICGDIKVAVGIFYKENGGKRAGYYTYLSPGREEDALGTEFRFDKDLTVGEYLIRIFPVDINTNGKYTFEFSLNKNPDE